MMRVVTYYLGSYPVKKRKVAVREDTAARITVNRLQIDQARNLEISHTIHE
jgi:hypothetical protein